MLQKDAISNNKSCSSRGPFVYGFIDLFGGSGESWNWPIDMDKNRSIVSAVAVQSHASDGSKIVYNVQEKNLEKNPKPLPTEEKKKVHAPLPVVKLDTLEEESEEDSKSISTADSSNFVMEGLVRNDMKGDKEVSHTGLVP